MIRERKRQEKGFVDLDGETPEKSVKQTKEKRRVSSERLFAPFAFSGEIGLVYYFYSVEVIHDI